MNQAVRDLIAKAHVPGREVPCPYCRVDAGRPCTGRAGQQLHNLHASRYETAGLPTALERREPT